MPFTKLQFRPGINREVTSYSNEGGWFDSEKIRFKAGFPEKIGGWTRKAPYSFLGICRSIHSFVSLGGTQLIGVGTTYKFYIEEGGYFYDITPIRLTTAAGDPTFSAVSSSSTLTVTETDHGAAKGDFVTFSGAVSLGGNITADVLNQEYQIDEIVDNDNYTISARAANTSIASITVDGQLTPSLVTADGSDTGNGGGSVVAAYQINSGLGVVVTGTGWGAGTWGRSTWGSGTTLTNVNQLRVYSQDNFGEDLIFNPRAGGIYYWDTGSSIYGTDRAVALSSLAGADPGTPTKANQVLVSDVDRHIILFGCDPSNNLGTIDPLLIRFSDQESLTTWDPTTQNTAGDLRVGTGSEIICAVETRQQILVFTDASVHAMQYLGPPFTFGINQLSENTTIMGPNAAVSVDDNVFWMGSRDFYVYNGQVSKLPCSVLSYVFNDFNYNQNEKVASASNSAFSEIWWFYPSSSSSEIDRYVVYNYQQNIWYYGTLTRTAWQDRGLQAYPVAAGTDGYLYLQENGQNDGSTNPSTAITSYIESSQIDIGDGDRFVFINSMIPDVTFDSSVSSTPTLNFTLETRNYPGGAYLQTDTGAVTQSATTPVEQFTNQVFVRLRGRSFALKVESNTTDVQWRLGSPRIDARQDGRR